MVLLFPAVSFPLDHFAHPDFGLRSAQKKNAPLTDGESAGSFTDNPKRGENSEMFSQL